MITIPPWVAWLIPLVLVPFFGVLITLDRRLFKVELMLSQTFDSLSKVLDKLSR